MKGFMADMIGMAENARLPKLMIAAMIAAYNEGRLINENTEADWHRPGFNFRSEIWKELIDAANYVVEGRRQGQLDEFESHTILQSLKCVANKLLRGGDTDD